MKSDRRTFLFAGLGIAAASLSSDAQAQAPNSSSAVLRSARGRRKLGSLEVSAIGLGCMEASGVYSAIPPKDQMIAVIRRAVDVA